MWAGLGPSVRENVLRRSGFFRLKGFPFLGYKIDFIIHVRIDSCPDICAKTLSMKNIDNKDFSLKTNDASSCFKQ